MDESVKPTQLSVSFCELVLILKFELTSAERKRYKNIYEKAFCCWRWCVLHYLIDEMID